MFKIAGEDMLNGAICAQYKKCGKSNCKCSRGELHGPYYYRFMWLGGRVIKSYVKLKDVDEQKAACARYRALQNKLLAGRQRYSQMIATLRSQLRGFEL
jgi:hypothetical protein